MTRSRWFRLGLGALTFGLLVLETLPRGLPGLADSLPPPSRAIATLWHLRGAKVRLDDPPRLAPMSVTEVIALPTFPLYPTFAQLREISALERRGVTVTGYLARVRLMRDGDYKLQITEGPPGRCLRVNAMNQLITELTPGVRARKPAYTWAKLEALCGSATPIRVSGWLMYDFFKKGVTYRSTPWEVHPITRIEVCCWRELS